MPDKPPERIRDYEWATRPSASDYVVLEGPTEIILAFLNEANARQIVKRHNAALASQVAAEIERARSDERERCKKAVLGIAHEVRKGAAFGNQSLRLDDVLAALEATRTADMSLSKSVVKRLEAQGADIKTER